MTKFLVGLGPVKLGLILGLVVVKRKQKISLIRSFFFSSSLLSLLSTSPFLPSLLSPSFLPSAGNKIKALI
jgi:hypothetical protein